MRKTLRALAGLALVLPVWLSGSEASQAQQIRGTPGSPEAVEFPDSRVLPTPPAPFTGEIGLSAQDSTPAWPPTVAPPEDAPNILLILTDDVGFSAPSTFGGVIPTPALDRIAQDGLRYTMFHTTALCSPTRAALLTGRNHHSVGFGVIAEQSTGFPGYNSMIERDTATIAEILRLNGYATAWFGKNHNVPSWEASAAGPFTRWPIGMGFDHFYGFVGGDTSQWQPNVFRNTTAIYPYVDNPDYNLTTAMADEAIDWIRMLGDLAPDRPWFIHYAPGGTHAPHHPRPQFVEPFEGRFDMGWNELREQIFANQRELGVIPANAQLAPWPDSLPEWDSLSDDERRLVIRQVEVYAGYLSYTDHEIGRVIQAVEDLGQLDNTLIIYISGDNGSSAEGTLHGTPNEVAAFNAVDPPVAEQLQLLDVWGTDRTYPHMAVGWTWAFDTPFRWTKQVASHFGGIRNGMAISWPRRITDRGGSRTQFHHVIDIVPTILDAVGIPQPDSVNGVAQRPIEGVSMTYTFDAANADAPSRRHTQYFEMFGNRAIYHDGWIASTTPPVPPWQFAQTGNLPDVVDGYTWELYNLADDPTQFRSVADDHPDRLRMMQDLFLMEATRYQVLPLDNQGIQRLLTPRPGPAAGRTTFTFEHPISGIPHDAAPSVLNRAYTITAEVDVPEEGGSGMLVTQGGRFGGYGFYLHQGRPTFTWNLFNLQRVQWQGSDALSAGSHTLVFEWTPDADGARFGRGGTGTLTVDGQQVAQQSMPHSVPMTLQWDETFDIGMDTGTPVDDDDYQVPFDLTGTLNRLTVELGASTVTTAAAQQPPQ